MVHAGGLFVIDFQDARMGPDTYDLASLLRDSYVDISEAELDEFIGHFLSLSGGSDAAEFRRRFDLMAVQRNLKALGTFGNQAAARGNPVYVQYMPRTIAVRANEPGAISALRPPSRSAGDAHSKKFVRQLAGEG